MNKKLLIIILLLLQFSCVDKAENNNFSKYYSDYFPTSTENKVFHNSYFSFSYLKEHELSEWTLYLSTKSHLNNRKFNPNSTFVEDPNIPNSINRDDYFRSGYDRGHLVPLADMQFDSIAVLESNYYTNTAPQTPKLNRGIWKKLEQKVREWTIKYDSLIIITGCVLKDEKNFKTPKIGKVSVPSFYYKVIIDKKRMSSIAFAIPNHPKENNLISYAISVKDLEKVTGLDFFHSLNDSTELIFESEKNINSTNNNQDKKIDVKNTIPAIIKSKKRMSDSEIKVIKDFKRKSNLGFFSIGTVFSENELNIASDGILYYDNSFDSIKDILFLDTDNPLKLDMANIYGFSFDDFSIKVSNQEILAKEIVDSSCYFLINPSKLTLLDKNGLKIKIFLKDRLFYEKYFKIKEIPYFQVSIGDFMVNEDSFIQMTRESLLNSKKISFKYGGYYFKGNKYVIKSVKFAGMFKGELWKVDTNYNFGDKVENLIRNTKVGNSITISNIQAIKINYYSNGSIKADYDQKILINSKISKMEQLIQIDPIVIEVVQSN